MNAPVRRPVNVTSASNEGVTPGDSVRNAQKLYSTPQKTAKLLDNVPCLPTPQSCSSPARAARTERSLEQMGIYPYSSTSSVIDEVEQSSPQESPKARTVIHGSSQSVHGTPLSMIPDVTPSSWRRSSRRTTLQSNINAPFVSPIRAQYERNNWFSNISSNPRTSSTISKRNWRRQLQDAAQNLVPKGDEGVQAERSPENRRMEEFMRSRHNPHTPPTPRVNNENLPPRQDLDANLRRENQTVRRRSIHRSSALQELPSQASPLPEVQIAEKPVSLRTRSRPCTNEGSGTIVGSIQHNTSSHLALERTPCDIRMQNVLLYRDVTALITATRIRLLDLNDAYDVPAWASPISIAGILSTLVERVADTQIRQWSRRLVNLLSRNGRDMDESSLLEPLYNGLDRHAVAFAGKMAKRDFAIAST